MRGIKWEACLLLHRDADAAAARKVADGLAAKMWWYNKKSYDDRAKECEATAQPPSATPPAR